MLKSLITGAFVAVVCVAAPAQAEPQQVHVSSEARSIPVRYADLNLEQRQDAADMLSRIRYAALRACDDADIIRLGPAGRRATMECRSAAVEDAVQRVDAPQLTLLNETRR